MATMEILDRNFGRKSMNRIDHAAVPVLQGALAALESFYHAFNQRSLEVLEQVWLDSPLIQLNNPLGGILRGYAPIRALYARVFNGPARVWVEFHDVVAYASDGYAVFAGRERGEFVLGETVVPLNIRTTRFFGYSEAAGGWRQVHHHGSIDDPALLQAYQNAVAPKPREP